MLLNYNTSTQNISEGFGVSKERADEIQKELNQYFTIILKTEDKNIDDLVAYTSAIAETPEESYLIGYAAGMFIGKIKSVGIID